MYDNESAKRQLVASLKARRSLLLAGAGGSRSVGYPSWPQLVEEMRMQFANDLSWPNDSSPMTFAGTIVEEIGAKKELPAYYNFLERRFEPRPDRPRLHDDFHVALVRLPFCGLVTTNYEPVIESAVADAFAGDMGPFRCEPIDLCDERVYRVLDFFRSLSNGGHPSWVLHLHGYYRNPQRIILTNDDYRRHYGEPPEYDQDGRPQSVILDKLHRKVLWTLFVTHPLVFVGFGLQDDFFIHMLRVLRQDLQLGNDLTHFAMMPFTKEEDQEKTTEYLRLLNTMPVFYHVPDVKVAGQEPDHGGLKRLVLELAEEVGVPVVSDAITNINKRMLEL